MDQFSQAELAAIHTALQHEAERLLAVGRKHGDSVGQTIQSSAYRRNREAHNVVWNLLHTKPVVA